MPDGDLYRIELDGTWSLSEFYELPHVFTQTYAFNYTFSGEDVRDPERVAHAFSSFPWRGGYSAVNFYNVLYTQIPRRSRPQVASIQYSSPGWIDLQLILSVAKDIAETVGVVAGAGIAVTHLYRSIYKGCQERKLLRLDLERRRVRLTREEIDFVVWSSERLSEALGFYSLDELEHRTRNHLASLKILMSYYRRVRTLVDFVRREKAAFPVDTDQSS